MIQDFPQPKYPVGSLVSVERWDATERPANRIGTPAGVIAVRRAGSESGWMITIVGLSSRMAELDQNWLAPYTSQQPEP